MKINEKEYKLELTGYTLVVYKQEFHRDLFNAIAELDNNIDVVAIMEIAWAFIKSSNNDVPSFNEFAKSIKDITSFLSKETIEEMTNAIRAKRTIEPKKA
ncbi:MAG: hypothetical protein KBT03_11510 [Bacteroidales bacterium]|nr:hypothetical protein [Candidatus Scybalousia scybalohippi]